MSEPINQQLDRLIYMLPAPDPPGTRDQAREQGRLADGRLVALLGIIAAAHDPDPRRNGPARDRLKTIATLWAGVLKDARSRAG